MGESIILWGLVFGSIGLGYVIYGRKQSAPIAFVCGLGLFGVPYIVESTLALIVAGVLLMITPLYIKL